MFGLSRYIVTAMALALLTMATPNASRAGRPPATTASSGDIDGETDKPSKAPIDFAWSGKVGFTLDRLPHAGRAGGVHYAFGYGGHGVALATWLGGRTGDAIAGGARIPELGPPPAVPLYGGRPWFLPLVDAYYRLRDRIG